MLITYSKPSRKEIDDEIKALERAAKRINSTPEGPKAFLVKNGFITKNGKLAKRYR